MRWDIQYIVAEFVVAGVCIWLACILHPALLIGAGFAIFLAVDMIRDN